MASKKENESSIKHVAIIMDGNGRWAQKRFRPRVWGHVRGAGIVADIAEEAIRLGIESVTLYSFSTENWSRPTLEIKTLFSLFKKFLVRERARLLKNEIRFRVIGDISNLPEETQKLIKSLEKETAGNKKLNLSLAFDYGGRREIVQSINEFIKKNPGKPITDADLNGELLTKDIGDVDLLIRTGGDQRISNFLLWQIAYAELVFIPTMWPEFTGKDLEEIYNIVSKRERRFGALGEYNNLAGSEKKSAQQKKLIGEKVN